MANEPVPQSYRKAYQDFSGGLNNFQNPLIIKENQFAELRNALINEQGILEKSKGYEVDGSPFPDDPEAFIRMIVNFKRGTAVDNLVVAALDPNNSHTTYKVDLKQSIGDGQYDYIGYTEGTATFTNNSTTVTGSGTQWFEHLKSGDKIKPNNESVWYEIASVTNNTELQLTSVFNQSTVTDTAYKARVILDKDFIPVSIVFNNKLIVTNASEKPFTWDNTTVKLINNPNAPRGRFIELHRNRVFMALGSNLYWSAVNDEQTWHPESMEPIFPEDNGNICAIKSFADSLIVLKDNGKIYQVAGYFDDSVEGTPTFMSKIDAPENIGTIAGFTAVVHDDGRLYFLSETGVYAMDQRLLFEKMSWNINGDTQKIILRPGTVSSKSFIFDTKAQWDAGTLQGVKSLPEGTISPYMDLVQPVQLVGIRSMAHGCEYSVAIDQNNKVHVIARAPGNAKLRYFRLNEDNTVDSEIVVDEGEVSVSIGAVAATVVSGVSYVAIIYRRALSVRVKESINGVWGEPVEVFTESNAAFTPDIQYHKTNTDLFVAFLSISGLRFRRRSSGTWGSPVTPADVGSGSGFASDYYINLVLNSSNNPRIMLTNNNTTTIRTYLSNNGGTTWSLIENFAVTRTDRAVYSDIDDDGNLLTVFTDSGGVKIRNHSLGTTSTITTSTTLTPWGFVSNKYDIGGVNESRNFVYLIGTESSIGKERFIVENNVSVERDLAAVPDRKPTRGLVRNGMTYAAVHADTLGERVNIRRIAFRGIWTSPEKVDSGLEQYGTYQILNQEEGGGSVLHEVAVDSISPPTNFRPISNGQVISGDATKNNLITRITMTLGSLNGAPSVDAIVMNYIGTGVGPTLPSATLFNNEYYLSTALLGDEFNAATKFLDRNRAWINRDYPVIFMSRYKGLLYAGSSKNGDVYKLNSGTSLGGDNYNFLAVSKEDLLGSVELEKDIYKIYLLYTTQSGGEIKFSYRLDRFINSSAEWHETSINQSTDGIAEIPVGNKCRSIQFKVEHNSPNTSMGIIGWVILFGYLNLR